MMEQLILALKAHAKGNIEKHKVNVILLLQKGSGIAEHPDIIETIEKELEVISKYDDQLEMLKKYFS